MNRRCCCCRPTNELLLLLLQTHEAQMKVDLRSLRNNAAFLFFMLNFLWLFIIFLLQVVQDQLKVRISSSSSSSSSRTETRKDVKFVCPPPRAHPSISSNHHQCVCVLSVCVECVCVECVVSAK